MQTTSREHSVVMGKGHQLNDSWNIGQRTMGAYGVDECVLGLGWWQQRMDVNTKQ